MNWDSWELPKNAWITALTVRAFTRSSSVIRSGSLLMLIRSLMSRARRHQGAALRQRLSLRGRRVLDQGVLDERRLAPPGRQEHVHLGLARLEELLLQGIRPLPARLGHDLARLGIGDVECQDRRP